jgi:hypothetical protein
MTKRFEGLHLRHAIASSIGEEGNSSKLCAHGDKRLDLMYRVRTKISG